MEHNTRSYIGVVYEMKPIVTLINHCHDRFRGLLEGLVTASSSAYPIRERYCPLRNVNIDWHGIDIADTRAKLHRKVFEDNSGALEMARVHKFHPRTKHLNVKLHHFRSYVERGDITIHAIPTTEQLSNYLTKPLSKATLDPLRKQVMGWTTTIVREREC